MIMPIMLQLVNGKLHERRPRGENLKYLGGGPVPGPGSCGGGRRPQVGATYGSGPSDPGVPQSPVPCHKGGYVAKVCYIKRTNACWPHILLFQFSTQIPCPGGVLGCTAGLVWLVS